MTSFGWKRKSTSRVSTGLRSKFQEDENNSSDGDEDEDCCSVSSNNIFLNLAKKRKAFLLEDNISKSERLQREGIILAESERFWEAINKWDEALQLTPGKGKIYDMKAQALMELSEVFPAVQAAERTVDLSPTWWVAHQTLARAQLGLGEIKMAKKSISRAIHYNPTESELREEDLVWISSLLVQKKSMGDRT